MREWPGRLGVTTLYIEPASLRRTREFHNVYDLNQCRRAVVAAFMRSMSPETFAVRCTDIISTMRGHAAHRALDLLTNDLLRALGYGDGIGIFEAAVKRWHDEDDPYPYAGPCPDCELCTAEAEHQGGPALHGA